MTTQSDSCKVNAELDPERDGQQTDNGGGDYHLEGSGCIATKMFGDDDWEHPCGHGSLNDDDPFEFDGEGEIFC